jgi:hypothetical protein
METTVAGSDADTISGPRLLYPLAAKSDGSARPASAGQRGADMMSVPMRSGPQVVPPARPVLDDDDVGVEVPGEVAQDHEEMLAADQSVHGGSHVNVTRDFGLTGGHEVGVNDAAFLNDETLVTAGADGKVCFWDIERRFVKSEFVPYDGESVAMLHVLPNEDTSTNATIMTLSSSREMRIWHTTEQRAVLLRSMHIPPSANDLVMSVPVITPELKARAVAAAAAAAVSVSPTKAGPEDPEMDVIADQKVVEVPAATSTPPSSTASPSTPKRNSAKFSLGQILSRRKDSVPA